MAVFVLSLHDVRIFKSSTMYIKHFLGSQEYIHEVFRNNTKSINRSTILKVIFLKRNFDLVVVSCLDVVSVSEEKTIYFKYEMNFPFCHTVCH